MYKMPINVTFMHFQLCDKLAKLEKREIARKLRDDKAEPGPSVGDKSEIVRDDKIEPGPSQPILVDYSDSEEVLYAKIYITVSYVTVYLLGRAVFYHVFTMFFTTYFQEMDTSVNTPGHVVSFAEIIGGIQHESDESEVDDEGARCDTSDEDLYTPQRRKRSKVQEVTEKKMKKTSSRGISVLPAKKLDDTKYYQHFKVNTTKNNR